MPYLQLQIEWALLDEKQLVAQCRSFWQKAKLTFAWTIDSL
jgi:hypothetical protein